MAPIALRVISGLGQKVLTYRITAVALNPSSVIRSFPVCRHTLMVFFYKRFLIEVMYIPAIFMGFLHIVGRLFEHFMDVQTIVPARRRDSNMCHGHSGF